MLGHIPKAAEQIAPSIYPGLLMHVSAYPRERPAMPWALCGGCHRRWPLSRSSASLGGIMEVWGIPSSLWRELPGCVALLWGTLGGMRGCSASAAAQKLPDSARPAAHQRPCPACRSEDRQLTDQWSRALGTSIERLFWSAAVRHPLGSLTDFRHSETHQLHGTRQTSTI